MFKTFRQSFAVKCTARANAFLFALKQIPLIKKLIPQEAYSARGVKGFAMVVIGLWEFSITFLTKAFYLGLVMGSTLLITEAYDDPGNKGRVFLHILLFLTATGGIINTKFLDSSKLGYNIVNLLRMDAKQYTLSSFFYHQLRYLIGWLPFSLLFGLLCKLPVWLCLLLPFAVVGSKLIGARLALFTEKRFGVVQDEKKATLWVMIYLILMFSAAIFLPIIRMPLPSAVSAGILLAMIPLGILCIRPILQFDTYSYKMVTRRLQTNAMNQMNDAKQNLKRNAEKNISADPSVTSTRSGFEFLNELFIKRHSKILWSATEKISAVLLVLLAAALILVLRAPKSHDTVNSLLMTKLPMIWLILYALNRDTSFTQSCFMNCDHSLLTYPFYKKPGAILRLFRIRLREISKINAVPAAIIGFGAALLLFLTGGTDNPLNYAVLIVAPIAVSMFFSLHYLMLYYLFQPYTAGTEMKGGAYSFITMGTYFICYHLMKIQLPTLMFGLMCILFCLCYCLIAYALVYKFAPKTFKLRN